MIHHACTRHINTNRLNCTRRTRQKKSNETNRSNQIINMVGDNVNKILHITAKSSRIDKAQQKYGYVV